jgi:hypothetical protein
MVLFGHDIRAIRNHIRSKNFAIEAGGKEILAKILLYKCEIQ